MQIDMGRIWGRGFEMAFALGRREAQTAMAASWVSSGTGAVSRACWRGPRAWRRETRRCAFEVGITAVTGRWARSEWRIVPTGVNSGCRLFWRRDVPGECRREGASSRAWWVCRCRRAQGLGRWCSARAAWLPILRHVKAAVHPIRPEADLCSPTLQTFR